MSNMSITGGNPYIPNSLNVDPTTTTNTSQTTQTDGTVLPPVSTYLSLPFSRLTFEMLGIPLPSSPEDTAAILSDVSLALERTVAEIRKNRDIAIAAGMRTAFMGLGGIVDTMMALQLQWEGLKATRDEKIEQRQEKIGQLSTKQQQSLNLGNQINTKDGQIGTLNQTISNLDTQISNIDAQIAGTSDPATITNLQAQRSARVSERTTADGTRTQTVNERNNLQTQKNTTDSEAAQLVNQINNLTNEINNLNVAMDATRLDYFNTQLIMLFTFSPIATFLLSREPINLLFGFQRDLLINRVFDDISDRLRLSNMPVFGRFEALAQLERIATINIAVRATLALNMAIGGNVFDSLAGQVVLGRILDMAMTDLALARFDPTGFHMARFLDRVMTDLALLGHPLMHPFDAMMLMDRFRMADALVQASFALGLGFNNFAAHMLMQNVFEAGFVALNSHPFDYFRNEEVLGRAMLAVAGYVGGLHDVLNTLALLNAVDDVMDVAQQALMDGFRLRLAI